MPGTPGKEIVVKVPLLLGGYVEVTQEYPLERFLSDKDGEYSNKPCDRRVSPGVATCVTTHGDILPMYALTPTTPNSFGECLARNKAEAEHCLGHTREWIAGDEVKSKMITARKITPSLD